MFNNAFSPALKPYKFPRKSADYEVNLAALHEFEEIVPLTLPERDQLRNWVKKGFSIDSNPWAYVDEDGYLMNYIQAYRLRYGYSSGIWDTWK